MSTDTATGLDPYRAWLNVQEVRRPLNAYQLLSIAPHEEDVEEIHHAGSMKRATLEAYRDDAPPEVWQQLHDELEQALEILLDPDKKRAYDLSLSRPPDTRKKNVVPPGAVTRDARGTSIPCGACGHENPAGRRFCSSCGQNMWEACFKCGTVSPVGEKYCGACGANLSAIVQEQIDQFHSDVAEVERMREEGRFDEAIALIGDMSRLEHPLLAQCVAHARQLIKDIAAERDQELLAAEEHFTVAKELFEQGDYEAAVAEGLQVAEPLRSEPFRELLYKAEHTRDEVAALDAEIRRAMESSHGNGLLGKVERLLEIKPDHLVARQAAQLLGARLCEAGTARLKKHQYDDALRLLDQMPRRTRSARAQKLHELASELAWLSWDLQKAPAVTPPLLGVAERLRKLAPGDPRGAKVKEELNRRLQIVSSEVRRTALPWAAAPEKPHLGFPTKWLVGFQRIKPSDNLDIAPLLEMPGRFAVACGVALQAASAAAIRVNFMPPDHGTMLSRVSRIIRKRPIRTAWGIDLGAAGLKAVKLTADASKPHVTIEECEALDHPKILSQAANDIEEGQIVQQTLRAFLDKHRLHGERVGVSLSSRLVLHRHLSLPPGDTKSLAKAVQFEAGHLVPHPLDQLVWGYQLLDNLHGGHPSEDQRTAILVAAKRDLVNKHLDRFERENVPVDMVQVDSIALYNLLAHEFYAVDEPDALAPNPERLTALLEIGHDSSVMVITGPQRVWFRNFGLGGNTFTRALVQEFNVTFAEAETMKRDLLAAPRFSRAATALQPVLDDLVAEIHRSIESFQKGSQRGFVTQLMGAGGGFQLHGLLRHLCCGR